LPKEGRGLIFEPRDGAANHADIFSQLPFAKRSETQPASYPRLGLSAVVEEKNGVLSCWPLKHPPGKPDFHHPDAFALELGLPES
jgi:hypothetical protein